MKLTSILVGATLAASTLTASAEGIITYTESRYDAIGSYENSYFAVFKGSITCEAFYRDIRDGNEKRVSRLDKIEDGAYSFTFHRDNGHISYICQPLSALITITLKD